MKKELWVLPLALTFLLSTPSTRESGCKGEVRASYNHGHEPNAYTCKVGTEHVIFFRDGKEFFYDQDVDSFTLGVEYPEGVMFHTINGKIYRGFMYHTDTKEVTQEYCIIVSPVEMC